MADQLSPILRWAFRYPASLSERSSLSRVRSAAPNNGAPLTSPGRPERTPSEKSERPDLEALKRRSHFAAIMAPFFTAIDKGQIEMPTCLAAAVAAA
jgi:hypothetical protein